MFFLKKLLSRLLFPVPLCAGLLVCGLVLWFFTKWKKTGRGLVVAGTGLLLLLSYPWLPRLALQPLESQHPPVSEVRGQGAQVGGHSGGFILVLSGGGLSADDYRPPNQRLADEGLKRVVEGVRLSRLFPNFGLLISLAGPAVRPAEKEVVLRELLAVFGLPADAARLCATARDTEDEILWCRDVAGTNQVLLVTSASHLPRALLLARRHGLNAVPAPSGFLVDEVTQSPFGPNRLFPASVNLYQSERAIHEYLGLAWETLRGRPKGNAAEPPVEYVHPVAAPGSNEAHGTFKTKAEH